ncbi:MAG: hypothetical protein AAF696_11695 [Bacteroidota bacterium]
MFLLVKTYKQKAPRQNKPFAEIESAKKKSGKKKSKILPFRMRGIWFYPLVAITAMALLAMVNTYQENLELKDIEVAFVDQDDNYFLDADKVKSLITIEQERELIGERMGEIGLRELEQVLIANPIIKKAEVFKSNSGILNVEVALRKPIARLINNSGHYIYLDEEGHKFPDSRLYSARVPLIRGDFEETVADTFVCETLENALPVLKYIQHNKFWNAQVSEIAIKTSGEMIIYPQVGDMEIDFGFPENIVEKFDNALVFYKQVVSKVGWDKYKSLNVNVKGQVVAKKKKTKRNQNR